jgi:hypothetical protein
MLADTHDRSPAQGSLSQDLHAPRLSIRRIVAFIAEQLPAWRDHGDRRPVRSEPLLNSQLCAYLNGAARRARLDSVQFCAEEPDETCKGRSLDIAALPRGDVLWVEGRRYSEFEVILPIECKRLPTPTENGRDEREYVITGGTTTGGIQRFKLGAHGAANPLALMIAYVQSGEPSQWVSTINRWIVEVSGIDASWQNERLVAGEVSPVEGVHQFRSVHRRAVASSPTVELQHIWILLHDPAGRPAAPSQLALPGATPERAGTGGAKKARAGRKHG